MRTRLRRFLLSALSLTLATFLLHSQVAEALVVRGDDLLASGDAAAAAARYERALAFDPGLESAADHLVFVSMESHTAKGVQAGIRIATAFLDRRPRNAALFADRALCFLIEHRYGAAARDFERSAEISGDAQSYVFAGWAARRAGQISAARRLWRNALHIRPASTAARYGLGLHG